MHRFSKRSNDLRVGGELLLTAAGVHSLIAPKLIEAKVEVALQ